MTTITQQAADAFRDYEVDGVPESGDHKPVKSEIRALFADIDTVQAGAQTLLASTFGLVDDAVLDQSVLFQAFLAYATTNNMKAVVDVANINCNGADIWMTPTGDYTFNGAVTGIHFEIEGVLGRNTRIHDVFMTFGKMYDSSGNYNITTQAQVRPTVKNLHFLGAVRFLNIENGMHVEGNTFFASQTTNFYSGFPATWGADPNNDLVIETPYTAIYSVVELITCNHITWLNNTTQNGLLAMPNPLNGIHTSQSSGVVQGGIVSNNVKGYVNDSHHVYTSASSQGIHIKRTHFESNTQEDIYLNVVQNVDIDAHFRKAVSDWDTAFPMVKISSSLLNENISVKGYFQSDSTAAGVAISADRCNGFTWGGYFKNVKTAAQIGSVVTNYKEGEPAYFLNGVDADEYLTVNPAATPRKLPPLVAAPVMGISAAKGGLTIYDNFLGITLDAAKWAAAAGTDPQCVTFAPNSDTGGAIAGVSGDSGASMAADGVQIVNRLVWLASGGGLAMECRMKMSSVASIKIFMGFTDTVALEAPFSISGADVVYAMATDAVGFQYDRTSITDEYFCVGVKAGVVATKVQTAQAGSTNVYKTFLVTVDASGNASFYYENVLIGYVADAVSPGVALTPVVACRSLTTATRTITLSRLACQQHQDPA